VFLVLAELFPVEAGSAERVTVIREAQNHINGLHPSFVDEVTEVLKFVGELHQGGPVTAPTALRP
jgi:hypothetical protein